VLIQAGRKAGVLRVRGRSKGLKDAVVEVEMQSSRGRPGVLEK
jgi:hypothetical protein